jgi:hypothetical protein
MLARGDRYKEPVALGYSCRMIDLLKLLWGALTGQFRCRVSLEAQSWFFAISLTC